MDAVEFVKEFGRICRTYNVCCEECPLYGEECAIVTNKDDPETLIEAVKKWSDEHPQKTRQDVFLEQWPDAELDDDGVLGISPCSLSKKYGMDGDRCDDRTKSCRDCRIKFWMEAENDGRC